jgi:UDP-N-acetylmuramoyl-tripeptide--D-alanyl-D-alanine ligase
MEPRSLKFIAAACAGELLAGSPENLVGRVCADSREARAGDLFFALRGEQFDGHDFLSEAGRKGVVAVVGERARTPGGLPCGVIAVDNPRQALGRLAGKYRADFSLPVVAVGGSNGKTTTKELVAAVLRQRFNTLWSEASFNNDVGVPMSLLRLERMHEAAVLEVGTNHPGELAPLVRMSGPRFGVLTSIGREHLEFFGDLAGVAEEEGRLAELLPADGKLFLNGDGEWSARIARRSRATVVRVGFGVGNDWRASDLHWDGSDIKFRVNSPNHGFSGEYRFSLAGRHQAVNALFALAIGAELGLKPIEAQTGLAECRPVKMRLQLRNWNGVCVLDDAYNANADSVLAALETLRDLPCGGRRVAVLGDMAELGVHRRGAHEEVGERVAQLGINQLFTLGEMADVTANAARAAGMKSAAEFSSLELVADAIKEYLKPGDAILFKASRAARLERLLEALRLTDAGEKV